MTRPSPKLQRRPEARAIPVEELVERVLRGGIRVPDFQRPLRWSGSDVRALLDSLWRGYPVGSLLMWKRRAEAVDQLSIGPVVVDGAPATDDAWWVVDGQQRLVSLAASLGRAESAPSDEVFDVWFDSDTETFVARHRERSIPTTWVPLRVVLDASRLQDWLYEWAHGRDAERRRSVLDMGTRLRAYQIPVYVIDVDDDGVLREVFRRVNRSGHPLTEPEVFDALYGTSPTSGAGRLSDLADQLSQEGWGRPAPGKLLQAVLGMAGRDVTRRLDQLDLDDAGLGELLTGAHVSLRRTIRFLRDEAEIPHLRVLPYSTPLVILPAFFHRFPEPSPRVLLNLVRWLWRAVFVGDLGDSPVRRAHAAAVSGAPDAEQAAMALLKLVSDGDVPKPWTVPERFDGRDAQTRIAVLGLTTMQPRHLEDEHRLDVRAMLSDHGDGAYRSLARKGGWKGVGHRLLHPPIDGLRRRVERRIEGDDGSDDVLRSHGIPAGTGVGTDENLFRTREQTIEAAVRGLYERLAAWDRPDRPSIDYLAGNEVDE